MNSIKDRAVAAITAVLRLDAAEVAVLRDESGYKQLRKWTSARHAEIIVALEDEFGIEIEDQEIPRLSDLAKIVAYLERTT